MIYTEWNGTYIDGVTHPPYIYEIIKGAKHHGQVDAYNLGGYT